MSNDRNSMGAAPGRGPAASGRLAAFSRWRTERPFWGSALAIVAGLEIYSAAAAPISVMAMQGLPGLLTIIVALVAVIMGAVTLFQPIQRVITGWVILVLGPISILATNLGGFVVGMILLVVGGALILSWQPVDVAAGTGTTATTATAGSAGSIGGAAVTAVHSPLVADPEYTPPEQRAAPAEPAYSEPAYSEPAYSEPEPSSSEPSYAEPAQTETFAEPVGYGDAAEYEPNAEPVAVPAAEPATRNPWRREPIQAATVDAEPVAEPVAAEPVAAEPVTAEPVAEPAYAEPAVQPVSAEPVSAEPVSAEPAPAEPAPKADDFGSDDSEVTRNPWRSRTPPPETPTNSSISPVAGDEGDTLVRGDKQDAGTRSWFGGNSQLPPMEPPKNFVRSTLLIPLILLSLAASGLLAAAPAQAGTGQQADGIFDWLLNPTPSASAPAAAPSAAPSATPSSGLTLPTLPTLPDLNLIPGTGDDKADTPADAAKAAELPTAACPTTVLPGTTAGGEAAIDGAAAIQACQAAGSTAKVAAAATGDPQNASGALSTMKASRLEMSGFKYNGIKTLATAKGPVKALSFSVDELKVTDYDHIYPNEFGETALKDGPLTVLKGNVKLYVTSMTGKIFGLLNLTFTPDFAPPLVLPSMFFTDTTSKVVYVSADSITLPKFGLEMK